MIAYINCIYATIAVKYETGKSRYPVLTYPEYKAVVGGPAGPAMAGPLFLLSL